MSKNYSSLEDNVWIGNHALNNTILYQCQG